MAKKSVTLKLKDDVEVRTLEELRKNFDLEKIVDAFKSGELFDWLDYRFYDDEADAISKINIGDDFAAEKICAALNVECNVDLEFTRRIREKKSALAKLTADEKILDNAAATALNQEDLAVLIHMGYKTIYLCGENFNVPIRVAGVHYVGILSAPKIKIRANSQSDLDAQKISFDNVQLPWQKSVPQLQAKTSPQKNQSETSRKKISSPKPTAAQIIELKEFAESIFFFWGENKWPVVRNGHRVGFMNQSEKSAALRLICRNKYIEEQIIYLQATADLSSGFALTIDSFCTGGDVGDTVMPFDTEVYFGWKAGQTYNTQARAELFNHMDYGRIENFIIGAKKILGG